MKKKLTYICQDCGTAHSKWAGQCGECQVWNRLVEQVQTKETGLNRYQGYAGKSAQPQITQLSDIEITQLDFVKTNLTELDRVLGGGLIPGSVILVGGDPGIGKSTLILQALAELSKQGKTLYVTGEESLQQVKLRADRLALDAASLALLSETQLEKILNHIQTHSPRWVVVDSIQTLFSTELPSAPGSVGQVRECAAMLVRFAKQTGTTVILIGHVTKEGHIAGPRVLEHMVDTVLYFEGQTDSQYRVIRAVKNRFGAVNELGVFAMTDKGLKGVSNPSRLFLSQSSIVAPGKVVTAIWEGSRPLLIEIQALVDESSLGNPRRVCIGIDANRLNLILAVLHRHGGISTYNQDVFLNVAGGMKITETAADVPLLLAVYSSLKDVIIPNQLMAFGEIGLSGEIRPVQGGQARLQAAQKHGFTMAIVPEKNKPLRPIKGLNVIVVKNIGELLAHLSEAVCVT